MAGQPRMVTWFERIARAATHASACACNTAEGDRRPLAHNQTMMHQQVPPQPQQTSSHHLRATSALSVPPDVFARRSLGVHWGIFQASD